MSKMLHCFFAQKWYILKDKCSQRNYLTFKQFLFLWEGIGLTVRCFGAEHCEHARLSSLA